MGVGRAREALNCRLGLAFAAFLGSAAASAHAGADITYSKNRFRAVFEVEQFKNGQRVRPSYETWEIQCGGKSPRSCSMEQTIVITGTVGCTFVHHAYSTSDGSLTLKTLSLKDGVLDFSFREPGSAVFGVHVTFLENGPSPDRLLKDFKATGSWPDDGGALVWEYRLPEFEEYAKPDCRFFLRGYKGIRR